MSIDPFLSRVYDPINYNCAHFVCEVWAAIEGPEMAERLRGFLCPPKNRRAVLSDLKQMKVLQKPRTPCVVFMQASKGRTHVGIWINGRVLHLQQGRNAHYQPLDVATIGFKRIRFVTC